MALNWMSDGRKKSRPLGEQAVIYRKDYDVMIDSCGSASPTGYKDPSVSRYDPSVGKMGSCHILREGGNYVLSVPHRAFNAVEITRRSGTKETVSQGQSVILEDGDEIIVGNSEFQFKQALTSKLYELGPAEKTFVVGDLHGDLRTFEYVVDAWRRSKNSNLIFLGDYADRGEQGVEIIESLMELSKQKGVIALKGNHENYSPSGVPQTYPCDLKSEVMRKRGDWDSYFNQKLKPFFDSLYLSAIIPGSILFVHGGISSKIKSVEDLRRPTSAIEADILWSDPRDEPGEVGNSRGAGVEFGQDVTDEVTKNLGVDLIIRSHYPQWASEGPHFHHNGKVVTISSARYYGRPHYLEIDAGEIPKILGDMGMLWECTRYVE
jgi:hypothetical protein